MEGEPSSIPLKPASFTQSLQQHCELWPRAGGRFYFCFQGTAFSLKGQDGWGEVALISGERVPLSTRQWACLCRKLLACL